MWGAKAWRASLFACLFLSFPSLDSSITSLFGEAVWKVHGFLFFSITPSSHADAGAINNWSCARRTKVLAQVRSPARSSCGAPWGSAWLGFTPQTDKHEQTTATTTGFDLFSLSRPVIDGLRTYLRRHNARRQRPWRRGQNVWKITGKHLQWTLELSSSLGFLITFVMRA